MGGDRVGDWHRTAGGKMKSIGWNSPQKDMPTMLLEGGVQRTDWSGCAGTAAGIPNQGGNIMKWNLFAGVGTLAVLLAGCQPATSEIAAVTGFDPAKYMGEWYELARLPHSFERGMDYVKAEYTRLENGLIPIEGTRGFNFAQAAAGGIPLAEIDLRTMQSRKQKGLYFAGEVVDVVGPCGGYNLTWAIASGMTAGESAGRQEN